MSSFIAICPHCSRPQRASAEFAGRLLRCPACSVIYWAPQQPQLSETAPAPAPQPLTLGPPSPAPSSQRTNDTDNPFAAEPAPRPASNIPPRSPRRQRVSWLRRFGRAIGWTVKHWRVSLVVFIAAAWAIFAYNRAQSIRDEERMRVHYSQRVPNYRPNRAAVSGEIRRLEQAFERFRMRFGSYPPDGQSSGEMRTYLKRTFPKNKDDWSILAEGSQRNLNDMGRSEALVFWLSQLRRNPLRRLSSQFGEEDFFETFYHFDERRLVDQDNDGWKEYVSSDHSGTAYLYVLNRNSAEPKPRVY